tara:strand:- start:712 stop:1635 length:924 start_codon:yes stop_codon:yes gene_type:complete
VSAADMYARTMAQSMRLYDRELRMPHILRPFTLTLVHGTSRESADSFFLRVETDEDGSGVVTRLTLCDGTATWSGDVVRSALTPPRKMPRDDFAARLLEGLKGDAAEDGFELEVLPEGRRRLGWSAIKRGVVDQKLEQSTTLLPEEPPGAGLRALLLELTDESAALQDECRAQTAKSAETVVEHAELDGVAARLEGAPERMRQELRARCLAQLNAAKARIVVVDDAINAHERGDDGFEEIAGPVSPKMSRTGGKLGAVDDFYDSDVEEEETQVPALTLAGSKRPRTPSPPPVVAKQPSGGDVLDMLD